MSSSHHLESLVLFIEDSRGIKPHTRRMLLGMMENLKDNLEQERQRRYRRMLAASKRKQRTAGL